MQLGHFGIMVYIFLKMSFLELGHFGNTLHNCIQLQQNCGVCYYRPTAIVRIQLQQNCVCYYRPTAIVRIQLQQNCGVCYYRPTAIVYNCSEIMVYATFVPTTIVYNRSEIVVYATIVNSQQRKIIQQPVGKRYSLPTVRKVSSSDANCWKSVGKVSGAFTDLAQCP